MRRTYGIYYGMEILFVMFVKLADYESFLTTKISQITVVYTYAELYNVPM